MMNRVVLRTGRDLKVLVGLSRVLLLSGRHEWGKLKNWKRSECLICHGHYGTIDSGICKNWIKFFRCLEIPFKNSIACHKTV